MDQTGSCRLLREEQRIMKYYKTPGFDEMNQFLRMNQFFALSNIHSSTLEYKIDQRNKAEQEWQNSNFQYHTSTFGIG